MSPSHVTRRMKGEDVDMSSRRLLALGGGVLLFHVINSILQEAVFTLPGFDHVVLLAFLQCVCIAGIAWVQFARQGGVRKTPLVTYFILSLLSTVSVILTNEASRALNYPTQVIFKSSKLLVVMLVRMLIFHIRGTGDCCGGTPSRRRTRLLELISGAIIVGGLIVFTWATMAAKAAKASHVDAAAASSTMMFGVVAIFVALLCDALLYVGEEAYCFAQNQSSNTEVIAYCYSFVALNSLVTLTVSSSDSIMYVFEQPRFAALVVAFSLCNFCGTTFLLRIVSDFDSNTAVMVTSVRKMVTVLCSFLIYPKPFTLLHGTGFALVTGGIWVFELVRIAAKKDEKAEADASKSGIIPGIIGSSSGVV